MIKYTLKCACDHQFESWFQSAAAFDKLSGAGMVTCAVCGSSAVEKAMMAPRVRTGRKAASQLGEAEVQTPSDPAQTPPASPPEPETALAQSEAETALRKIREKVEANSDYVGSNFVEEARAMHQGEAPERSIYGEAKPAEAKELIEEGVPVLPLPFVPGRKTN